ncbi:MAG: hypothetical protein RI952_203 [Bacteroidota bacterium]|jgi:hypothetical protein
MLTQAIASFFKKNKILIAFAASSQVLLTYLIFRIPFNIPILLFVFIATNFIYLISEDFSSFKISIFQNRWRTKNFILLLEIISLFKLALGFKVAQMILITLLGIIAISYNYPFKFNKNGTYRIREAKFMKLFVIVFVWSASTVIFPLLYFKINPLILILFFINSALLISIVSLKFDIKDYFKDTLEKLKSIPVLIGPKQTKKLLNRLMLIYFISTISLVYFIEWPIVVALLLNLIYSYWLIFKYPWEKGEWYYQVLLDGILISQAFIVWIGKIYLIL